MHRNQVIIRKWGNKKEEKKVNEGKSRGKHGVKIINFLKNGCLSTEVHASEYFNIMTNSNNKYIKLSSNVDVSGCTYWEKVWDPCSHKYIQDETI